jgi:cyanophycinase-like exopeptidase
VVIAAIGAAASCFGISARDMAGNSSAIAALGWLANTAIDTAFDPQNDTALRRLMSLPDVTLGIGIPPKTALVVNGDGTTEIIGAGQIAAFRKS